MKNMIKTLLMFMMILGINTEKTFAGETKEIKIKTTVNCKTCEANVKKRLEFEKGVQKIDVDLETKIVTVSYDAAKTNPDKIRTAISKAGYDADEVKADPKAYKKLKPCCKKEGM